MQSGQESSCKLLTTTYRWVNYIKQDGEEEDAQQLLFPLCLLPEGNLTFFQDSRILLLAGWGKGVLPTKKQKQQQKPTR